MRAAALLTMLTLAGCAAQAPAPQNAAAAAGAADAGTAAAAPTESEAKRIALAQKMHLKLVNQDGEEVFCKSSLLTGSHIRTEMRCYTAAEMDRMEERTQRDVDELNKLQSHPSTSGLPSN
jgi:hypothetical protein